MSFGLFFGVLVPLIFFRSLTKRTWRRNTPTIAIFYGIVIQMYWRDHAPPHLHAYYQGFEGLVSIETGEVIGGLLPPSAARIVRQWVLLRKADLMENWQRGRHRVPFERVPGPDEEP